MLLIRNNARLQEFIVAAQKNGSRIGFVPTMGALHDGHLALVRQASSLSDLVVCSIFVNPTQFDDPADLEKYPRPITRDIALLNSVNCDIVYLPGVDDIYPPGLDTTLDIQPGALEHVMEGEFRPGHFTGVMQVVKRLLDLVTPDILVMGQKDYQQVAIIRFMLQALKSKVELVVAPTVREPDGLAMSSRNVRLTKTWRSKAPLIYQILTSSIAQLGKKSPSSISRQALDDLGKNGFRSEYVRVVDGVTLQDIQDPAGHDHIVICVAAWAGDVRLIDNIICKP